MITIAEINRRCFARRAALFALGVYAELSNARGRCPTKIYLTPDQAKQLIWSDLPMHHLEVALTEAQSDVIERESGVWMRKANKTLKALRSFDNQWLIYDQVIGKHENIDLAVGITNNGKIKAIEILVYRESYGCEILHPKWLGQFLAKDVADSIQIDRDIINISGATLSCVHVTNGVNRLIHTWDQVLKHL